jgi:hypothetical protein
MYSSSASGRAGGGSRSRNAPRFASVWLYEVLSPRAGADPHGTAGAHRGDAVTVPEQAGLLVLLRTGDRDAEFVGLGAGTHRRVGEGRGRLEPGIVVPVSTSGTRLEQAIGDRSRHAFEWPGSQRASESWSSPTPVRLGRPPAPSLPEPGRLANFRHTLRSRLDSSTMTVEAREMLSGNHGWFSEEREVPPPAGVRVLGSAVRGPP